MSEDQESGLPAFQKVIAGLQKMNTFRSGAGLRHAEDPRTLPARQNASCSENPLILRNYKIMSIQRENSGRWLALVGTGIAHNEGVTRDKRLEGAARNIRLCQVQQGLRELTDWQTRPC